MWDFAGQREYHSTHELYFTPGAVFVVCYDLGCGTDKSCFNKLFLPEKVVKNDDESSDSSEEEDDEEDYNKKAKKSVEAFEQDVEEKVRTKKHNNPVENATRNNGRNESTEYVDVSAKHYRTEGGKETFKTKYRKRQNHRNSNSLRSIVHATRFARRRCSSGLIVYRLVCLGLLFFLWRLSMMNMMT